MKPKPLVLSAVVLVIAVIAFTQYQKINDARFKAPRQNTPDIQFTIGKNFSLDAVVNDLEYYDFVKDAEALRYALEHSVDNTSGDEKSLRIGDNTIDRESRYTINQSWDAWKIAQVLLNEGQQSDCDHGCPESNFSPELLPGGDLAPNLDQRFSWIETYDDCVGGVATGHEGGMVLKDKGLCTSPDGRYFKKGVDGWTDVPSQ